MDDYFKVIGENRHCRVEVRGGIGGKPNKKAVYIHVGISRPYGYGEFITSVTEPILELLEQAFKEAK